jgi:hypothetical protein
MSCNVCGGELFTAPLESQGESGRYGGLSWNEISIPRPQRLEEKWEIMHKLYIDAFYSGSKRDYLNDTYRDHAPEKDTEFEPIMNYSYARPTVSLKLCLKCGTNGLTTDLKEIFDSIDVLTQWIETEIEARKQNRKAEQKKIRDEKRKNYEKQIAALQKKLNILEDK